MSFASHEDRQICRELHRRFGTTYYFANRRFEPRIREKVDALYAFVRVPDEWVDNPTEPVECVRERLADYRAEMEQGIVGARPNDPVLRTFCDLLVAGSVPVSEARLFLHAMEMDLSVTRYESFTELEEYMRGSAGSVGVMMAAILEAPEKPEVRVGAIALGIAMQLTNFLRDIAEDFARGRIYLPLEDLARFDVSECDIAEGKVSDQFIQLMMFEIARTRSLYEVADEAIPLIPRQHRVPVRLARVLYARILDRIECMNYDVFAGRARTSKIEKVGAAVRLAASHFLR